MKKFDKETDANILMSLDMMVQVVGGTMQKSCVTYPSCQQSCISKCKQSGKHNHSRKKIL